MCFIVWVSIICLVIMPLTDIEAAFTFGIVKNVAVNLFCVCVFGKSMLSVEFLQNCFLQRILLLDRTTLQKIDQSFCSGCWVEVKGGEACPKGFLLSFLLILEKFWSDSLVSCKQLSLKHWSLGQRKYIEMEKC